jgi:hypothetical protein
VSRSRSRSQPSLGLAGNPAPRPRGAVLKVKLPPPLKSAFGPRGGSRCDVGVKDVDEGRRSYRGGERSLAVGGYLEAISGEVVHHVTSGGGLGVHQEHKTRQCG